MAETILIVGGTGGLGSAMLRRLAGEGYMTKALVRDPLLLDQVAPGAASSISMGDALHSGIVAEAARNCTTLINCVDFELEKYEKHLTLANLLVEAAEQAGARLFYPTPAWSVGSDKDGWTRPDTITVGQSRTGVLRNRAERTLRESAQQRRVPLTLFRLPTLYGPHCSNSFLTPLFKDALAGKRLHWPNERSKHHDLLFVDNAALALSSALPAARLQEVYCVSSGVPITGDNFCQAVSSLTGGRSKSGGFGSWLGNLRTGKSTNSSREQIVAALFGETNLLDDSSLRQELGYRPVIDFNEGLRRSIRWADDLDTGE